MEDLAWEEPEASAADGAANSAQPGVAHQAEPQPASQVEAQVGAPGSNPHADLAETLAAAATTPAAWAFPPASAAYASSAALAAPPPLEAVPPDGGVGAGASALPRAAWRDDDGAGEYQAEPEPAGASLRAALLAAFGEDGAACDPLLADYGGRLDGRLDGGGASWIPPSSGSRHPSISKAVPLSGGSSGRHEQGDALLAPLAATAATPHRPLPAQMEPIPARWAAAEAPPPLPEQRAAWLPGRSPQLIEHHVAAALADSAGAPSAAGVPRLPAPPSSHRTVLSDLKLSWLVRPGLDWPQGERRVADASQGLELRVRGLNLQMDRYVPPTPAGQGGGIDEGQVEGRAERGGPPELEWRLSLVVRELEVLDRLHGEKEAGREAAGGGGGAGAGAAWPLLLELDRSSLLPRDSGAFVTLHMESVAAEVRLRLQLQPLRLCVDQRSLDFLLHFVHTALAAPADADAQAAGAADAAGVAGGGGRGDAAGSGTFFQMCDVRPLHLCIDYLPRRPSCREVYANPSRHHLANLLPLREVRLSFGRLRLAGQRSWETLLQARHMHTRRVGVAHAHTRQVPPGRRYSHTSLLACVLTKLCTYSGGLG